MNGLSPLPFVVVAGKAEPDCLRTLVHLVAKGQSMAPFSTCPHPQGRIYLPPAAGEWARD